jgi:hypothetical protein
MRRLSNNVEPARRFARCVPNGRQDMGSVHTPYCCHRIRVHRLAARVGPLQRALPRVYRHQGFEAKPTFPRFPLHRRWQAAGVDSLQRAIENAQVHSTQQARARRPVLS